MKRTPALLAAPVCLMLALTACSGGGGSSSGSDGPVELTFWHGYTEADGDVLEQIVEDFNAAHDGEIAITTEVNPWDVIDDTFLPALSADNGPELVAMPAERLPVYADRGAFVDLDDFYAGDEATPDLNQGALDMVTVDGTAYGVPTGFVPLTMFYNKALFAQAGVEVPTTWDEWVAAAEALTVDQDGDGTPEQYGLVLTDHATVGNGVWPTLFYGNGGAIVEDGEAVIDSPENAETLEFWHDAIAATQLSPTGVDGIAGDGLYSSGRVGMYIGGPWMASISEENGIDYGIAPIPAGPETQAASAIGVAMALTEQADQAQQEAAQEFFRYFLAHEQAVTWSLGSGWPPLRTDVTTDEVDENPVVAALTEQAELGRPLLPGVVNSTDVLTAVDDLTQRAMAGEPVDELLAEAQTAVQAALDD
ncbi:sugar ABC transporter substrate-binding protein [Cellulomonas hominis]|uniref:Multiple sugar transport system substrate-binding protein n=1 Tax=Cellulomonas hominis TaxID=156981 RepID=A0A511FC26_9CELL|nr:ABC transporter substrate-binding protein [Cellulomonas hominis]MBB5472690.1 multiple sugar transport system substrate-binding protein [Cellulomonas hominis]NKY08360.1 ABC transporter substrate-binding protein [Cellulomonas hominis]GEL46753.1 sugar ABC transporter substrate-binding protein [Cellulomonas hominis]